MWKKQKAVEIIFISVLVVILCVRKLICVCPPRHGESRLTELVGFVLFSFVCLFFPFVRLALF